MTTKTIVGPSGLAVSLVEAKAHLRVDHDDDDLVIDALLRTAIEYVEAQTYLKLAPVTLRFELVEWPGCSWIELPRAPIRDVESITYLDGAGAEQILPVEFWFWERLSKGRGAFQLRNEFSAPALTDEPRAAVFINFTAGFDLREQSGSGDDPELKLPFMARAAVLLLVGHWYENREATATSQLHNLPAGVEAMINVLRIYK